MKNALGGRNFPVRASECLVRQRLCRRGAKGDRPPGFILARPKWYIASPTPRIPQASPFFHGLSQPPHFRIFAIAKTWYAGIVEEKRYRQSRLCRVLGNPLAFAVVQTLAENGEMSPSQIAAAVGRSISRVSNVLAALRLADVVRYKIEGRTARYRLKHPRETRRLLAALGGFIESASSVRR